jgi:hypothetical protein
MIKKIFMIFFNHTNQKNQSSEKKEIAMPVFQVLAVFFRAFVLSPPRADNIFLSFIKNKIKFLIFI